jgi:hypothetical protein
VGASAVDGSLTPLDGLVIKFGERGLDETATA